MNINEKIKKLEQELKEVKEEFEAGRDFGRVEKDKSYWYLSTTGTAHFGNEDNGDTDDGRYDLGNYFYSDKEAIKAAKKQKAATKINRYILRRNEEEGFVMDWEEGTQHKYFIYYNYSSKQWSVDFRFLVQSLLGLEHTNEEIAGEVIEKFEEELNLLK